MKDSQTQPAGVQPSRVDRSRSQGFTVIEILIAFTIMAIALTGVAAFVVASNRAIEQGVEEAHATNALRSLAERMRSSPFDQIVDTYDGLIETVPQLDNGRIRVRTYVNENESSVGAVELGLPRDLDADGVVSNSNVSSTYKLLPVRIRVNWEGADGARTSDLAVLFAPVE